MSKDSSKPKPALEVSPPVQADSKPRNKLPGPFLAIILTIASFVGCAILGSIIVEGLVRASGAVTSPPTLFGSETILQFAYMLVAYGLMFAVAVAILGGSVYGLRAVGLMKPKFKDIGYALLAFGTYIVLYLIIAAIVQQFLPSVDLDQKQDVGFDDVQGANLAIVFVLLVLAVPFVEEFLMRGLLFSSLRQKLTFASSTIITSLIFASLHLGGGESGAGPLWIAAIDTFVLSVVLCYLREKTGSLWAGIGLHAIKNGIAFAALFIFVSN